jgi:hypothetical protein
MCDFICYYLFHGLQKLEPWYKRSRRLFLFWEFERAQLGILCDCGSLEHWLKVIEGDWDLAAKWYINGKCHLPTSHSSRWQVSCEAAVSSSFLSENTESRPREHISLLRRNVWFQAEYSQCSARLQLRDNRLLAEDAIAYLMHSGNPECLGPESLKLKFTYHAANYWQAALAVMYPDHVSRAWPSCSSSATAHQRFQSQSRTGETAQRSALLGSH